MENASSESFVYTLGANISQNIPTIIDYEPDIYDELDHSFGKFWIRISLDSKTLNGTLKPETTHSASSLW